VWWAFGRRWALQAQYRRQVIVAELARMKPDIVCFQVWPARACTATLMMVWQELGHVDAWRAALEPLGYEGRHQARSGRNKVDGCATFVNTAKSVVFERRADRSIDGDRFEIVSAHPVE